MNFHGFLRLKLWQWLHSQFFHFHLLSTHLPWLSCSVLVGDCSGPPIVHPALQLRLQLCIACFGYSLWGIQWAFFYPRVRHDMPWLTSWQGKWCRKPRMVTWESTLRVRWDVWGWIRKVMDTQTEHIWMVISWMLQVFNAQHSQNLWAPPVPCTQIDTYGIIAISEGNSFGTFLCWVFFLTNL